MPVTVTPEPGQHPPRMRVQVTNQAGTQVSVVRVDVGGATETVRTPIALAGGSGQTFDHEALYGVPCSYRVAPSGVGLGEQSGRATLAVRDVWLVHPFVPSLSVRVPLDDFDQGINLGGDAARSTSRPSQAAFVEPANRHLPLVQRSGRRRGASSQLGIDTWTAEQFTAMEQLVESDATVLLNVPGDRGLRLRSSWVQFLDVDSEYLGDDIDDHAAAWQLPYRVVGRPEGDAAVTWAYADVAATYRSYADLETTYLTYADLEADLRRLA